ncbi:hypothetical protein D5F01_LYC20780 [Larimichthys crocea]|uniref:PiggyBac transposable element-derived protein domain-containing protein n=1 Tax=Larimichthys crocea TaxID=215358 RepID=A0A6G0HMM8_LARCR|nr:hypothetical protein D5F01_LYC20780 [Larimichthys crocea]
MDEIDLHAYMGLLILAGVYRSRGEATASLWDAESGRAIFRATMSLKVFHVYSKLVRFDDCETRAERRASDKLAAVRKVWDTWVERLPTLYNPGPHVTLDEQLVPFRGFLLVLSSKFTFTRDTALVTYLAKKNKNVLLLSMLHARTVDVVGRQQRADDKPAVILDYNSNKGAWTTWTKSSPPTAAGG